MALDIECLDQIYLNAYVPILQTSSQVVAFLSGHLGFQFPSTVLFRQLGERFRREVASFADAHDIPWVRFGKDEAKLAVMAVHLGRQAITGRSGMDAIGVAQEFQRVWTAYAGKTWAGTPRWSFVKADRRVTPLNPQVELVVHVVTRARSSGLWRRDIRRSGGAGTEFSSACA